MPALNDVSFDMIRNGVSSGDVGDKLLQSGMDVGALRPFIGESGKSYITINGKPIPTQNAATLRKDDWIQLDEAIIRVAKPRLKAVGDLRARGLTFTIANGMGTTVLQTENISDIDPAIVSMDGLREGKPDRPEFDITNLPLPIIHKDFHFSLRQLQASRNGGSPLDTSTAELAARRVAEEAEKMLLGVSTVADTFNYAGSASTIYGYTDFPSRLTVTLTTPTGTIATDGAAFLNDVMEMMQASRDAYHYGPWVLYVASAWDQYLDNDFKATSDKTIRNRVKELEGLEDIRTLDYLSDYDTVLVQMESSIVREVIGMDMVTLQWDSKGGLQKNFKIMTIMVPQLRADQNGNTGIVHGTV